MSLLRRREDVSSSASGIRSASYRTSLKGVWRRVVLRSSPYRLYLVRWHVVRVTAWLVRMLDESNISHQQHIGAPGIQSAEVVFNESG